MTAPADPAAGRRDRPHRAACRRRCRAPPGAGCWPGSTWTREVARAGRAHRRRWSARADRLTPLLHAAGIAAALPHCLGRHELPGLGHMTPIEDPDAVAEVAPRPRPRPPAADRQHPSAQPPHSEGRRVRMSRRIGGQVAVITGAARGVGALLARILAARGARIALVGLEPERTRRRRASRCPADPRTGTPTSPTGRDDGPGRRRDRASSTAGSTSSSPTPGIATGGPFLDSDPDACGRVIEVNLSAASPPPVPSCPSCVESRGYYLQIASLAALTPAPMMAAYCAARPVSRRSRTACAPRSATRASGRRRLPAAGPTRTWCAARTRTRCCASCAPGCRGRPTAPTRSAPPSTASPAASSAAPRTSTRQWWLRGMQACAATCRPSSAGPSAGARCGRRAEAGGGPARGAGRRGRPGR